MSGRQQCRLERCDFPIIIEHGQKRRSKPPLVSVSLKPSEGIEMSCRSIFPASLLVLLGTTVGVLANGAISEFPAGGVVFKHSREISIAREDLEIGWDRIRVHYVFESSASRPIERTIGFPTARISLDDSPDGIENRSAAAHGSDTRNYMAFEVRVDGKPFEPTLHEYAWSGDTNITRKLHDMGVPAFVAGAEMLKKLARLPEATVQKLVQEKLAEPDGDSLIPQWQYQTVYEWRQTFRPGRTEVDISYTPLIGGRSDYEYYYPGHEGARLYCFDDATKQKLAKIKSPLAGPEPFTVGYILGTARNWNGPIGAFRLEIVEKNSFSSFCAPDGLKSEGDGKSWSAQDFVPRSDLKILFFHQEK
jgi:hypothetical protein